MRKIKIIIMMFLTIFVFIFSRSLIVVDGETVNYSEVITDLKRDSNFDMSQYPSKNYNEIVLNDNRLLDIISIAESQDNSLVLYVYQPTDPTLEIVASSVSLSTGINDNFHPSRYNLKLLDTNGVFDKYLVENFSILTDVVRYYEITTIYYPYNELIGKGSQFDGTTNECGLEIGKRWTACTLDGQVTYSCLKRDTMKVTSIYPFMHRKKEIDDYIFAELSPYTENVDFHCVAFNTNLDMDYIYEIELEYKKVEYHETEINIFELLWWDLVNIPLGRTYLTEKESVGVTHKVIDDNEIANDEDNIFFPKYTWKRISTSNDFIDNNEDLSNDTKDLIDNYKWVLVFDTTTLEKWNHMAVDGYKAWETFDLIMLRFKFLKDDVVYNLGVVSDVVTGSNNPINEDMAKEKFDEIIDLIEKIFMVLGIAILIILLCVVCPPIVTIFKFIGQAFLFVLQLLLLPFKLIGSIFKKKEF